MQHFLKDLTIMLSGMAFHAADTHRGTSEGAARKGRLKERCGLEPRTNFFFRLRNRQKLVWVRFGCGLDSRVYGSLLLIVRFVAGMNSAYVTEWGRNYSDYLTSVWEVMVGTRNIFCMEKTRYCNLTYGSRNRDILWIGIRRDSRFCWKGAEPLVFRLC
jgi:hypothetical protein